MCANETTICDVHPNKSREACKDVFGQRRQLVISEVTARRKEEGYTTRQLLLWRKARAATLWLPLLPSKTHRWSSFDSPAKQSLGSSVSMLLKS